MSGARVWGGRLLVAVAAIPFASLMLISYLGILGFAFHENREAAYRADEAASLAAGDTVRALESKKSADFERLVNSRGRFGVAACLSSLAVFAVAVLVKRRSSRPSAIRAATFLTRSMFLGFSLSVVALVAIYALLFTLLFLTDE